MATIQIQIDDNTKTAADTLFNSYGINVETALKIFISTAVKQKGIPFYVQEFTPVDENGLSRVRQKRLSAKGSLKGKIRMSDDFDSPLTEMAEYM